MNGIAYPGKTTHWSSTTQPPCFSPSNNHHGGVACPIRGAWINGALKAETDDTDGESPGRKYALSHGLPGESAPAITTPTELTSPPLPALNPWFHDAMALPTTAPPAPHKNQNLSPSQAMEWRFLYEDTDRYSDALDKWLMADSLGNLQIVARRNLQLPEEHRRVYYGQAPSHILQDPEKAMDFTQVLSEDFPEKVAVLETLRRACLHMETKEESRDNLAYLLITFIRWSDIHCLGLTELLEAMEDGGEALAREYYEKGARILGSDDDRTIYSTLEHISRDLPRRLLSIPASTPHAVAAAHWLRCTQGSKRLRPLLGLPPLSHGHIYSFLDRPWRFNNRGQGSNGDALMAAMVREDVLIHLRITSNKRWDRLAGHHHITVLEQNIDGEARGERDERSWNTATALRGYLLAEKSTKHCYQIVAHPEWYNYFSFHELGSLVQEYNEEWALACWDPSEHADGTFQGFQFPPEQE